MQYTVILPILYVILSSILIILMRILQKEKDRSWALACLGSIFGSLVLMPFLNISELHNIPENQRFTLLGLLILAGVFWSLMVLLEYKALKYNQASQNIILNCIETSILVFLSWAVFKEEITTKQASGAIIIILSVLMLKLNTAKISSYGIYLKLTSILCSVVAICLDKYLVHYLGLSLVVFSGYFIPSLMYIFIKPINWYEQLIFKDRTTYQIAVLAIIFYIIIGPIYVSAYTLGNLFSTTTVAITRVTIVMFLAIYILKEKDNLVTKLICTTLSLIGIYLVLL